MILDALAALSVKDAAAAVAARGGPAATRGLRAGAQARRDAAVTAARPVKARRRAHLFGLRAESIAALLLRLKGYRCSTAASPPPAARSTSSRGAATTIAFVEVKARDDLDAAAIAITETKRRRIGRAARVWLARNPWAAGSTLRGDAVFVAPGRLPRHLVAAYRLEIE